MSDAYGDPTSDSSRAPADVPALLSDHRDGKDVLDELIPLVYDDLRRIAHNRLQRAASGSTLNTTAVVHEAYLKLVHQPNATWQDRVQFLAVASTVIRSVLVDYVRERATVKRGGDAVRIPLRDNLVGEEPRTVDLLALDEAMGALAEHDPRLEHIVECRFFGGMSMKDTARALAISLRTAERDWTRAKAYLYRALGPNPSPPV